MRNNKIISKINEFFREAMIIHNSFVWKCVCISIMSLVFACGFVMDNYNISLLSIILFLIYNIWYFFADIKERCIFFLMNFSIFLFLISRPLISMVRGNEWWYFKDYSIWMSLLSLFLVLLCLNIGYCHAHEIVGGIKKVFKRDKAQKKEKKYNHIDPKIMQNICLFLFAVGFIATMYQELPKLLYAMKHGYTEIYSEYVDTTPFVIRLFATMMPYFLCGFLVCFPTKRKAFIPLVFYIVSGMPGFISGARSAMMVKVMFVFMYYCLRDYMAVGKDVWLGKLEKILIIILLPVTIVGLGLYSYIREGDSLKKNDGNVIVDFFYLQGTSFDTVAEGFEYKDELRSSEAVISYTFGGFVDYIKYGTASQILFDAEDLGSGNSVAMATKSNSMAHHLSYLVLNKNYLFGHGRGSSFIIETYIDFGMIGMVLYTIILGMGLRYIPVFLKKNWFIRIITLVTLLNIFMVPRSAAMEMLNYIITFQFWIAIVMILFTYFAATYVKKRRLEYARK